MREENEIKLKRAYWGGVYDALNTPENAKSEKIMKVKLTAQVWLSALDWMLGQNEEGSSKVNGADEAKR